MSNDIRSKLLTDIKPERIKINMRGVEVEVQQPVVKDILNADTDDTTFIIDMMVRYCYVPGTNERVFKDEDKELILQWPMGEWFSTFGEAFNKLASVSKDEVKKK